MTRPLQGLSHEPYGLGHPYDPAPYERTPREPVAGQPVLLGAVTWPAGAAEEVWASWEVQGTGAGGRAAGVWVGDDQGQSCWKVQLPAFCGGQVVEYQLYVRQGDLLLSSGSCAFAVAAWHTVGEVVDCRVERGRLVLDCTAGDPAWRVEVTVLFHSPDRLDLRLAAGRRNLLDGPEPRDAAVDCRPQLALLETTDERVVVVGAGWHVSVERHPCRLALRREGDTTLLAEAEGLAWLCDGQGRALSVRQTFASPPEEAFYGLGERFNALDQRGNVLDVRVYEQYRSQGQRTYLPVPFPISSRGYGLHADTLRHVAYDLAATEKDRWSYTAELGPDGDLTLHILAGKPKGIVAAFTGLTGKPELPPAWAFGPWMSGNEWNSQAAVMEQVNKTLEHGIPATVMVIEAWSDEASFYIWNDAEYAPRPGGEALRYGDLAFPPDGRWPDPKGMIEELHRLGIRVLLWQIPVLKKLHHPDAQCDADAAYALARGYCVREADGRPYRIRPFWFHDGLLLDFTNPEAVQWWLSKRAYLLDELGVDGFKTDGGEHIWGRDLRFADGRRSDELWNLYPNLYVGAYHRFARERRGGDAITFSRAGYTGAQSYPCHWAGDEASSWEAFRTSILAGLNAGLSGIPFWGWDLAGFSGEIPSAELYLRAVAMAALCPIMQYHSEYNEHRRPCRDRTPWNIQERTGDQDIIPIFRKYANLRLNLLPYIVGQAWISAKTGWPLMRALPLEFPDDPRCRDYPYQYLFGDSLLVAPVTDAGCESLPVYLPAGRWHDFWTGEALAGAQVITWPAPRGHIPVFVRAGAVIPLNLGDSYELGGPVDNRVDRYTHLCFDVYPYGEFTCEWYDGTSGAVHVLRCHRRGEDGEVELPALPYEACLRVRAQAPTEVFGAGSPLARVADPQGWRSSAAGAWCYDAERGSVLVKAPSGLGGSVLLRGSGQLCESGDGSEQGRAPGREES